jgi:hypothetical protein
LLISQCVFVLFATSLLKFRLTFRNSRKQRLLLLTTPLSVRDLFRVCFLFLLPLALRTSRSQLLIATLVALANQLDQNHLLDFFFLCPLDPLECFAPPTLKVLVIRFSLSRVRRARLRKQTVALVFDLSDENRAPICQKFSGFLANRKISREDLKISLSWAP